jgi:hypothetical protein
MPVVINEFEIMPGETTPNRESTPASSEGTSQPTPSAREIALLLEQALERDERIWAH